MNKKIIDIEPEMMISVISKNLLLTDIYDHPNVYTAIFVGYVKEKNFYSEQKNKVNLKSTPRGGGFK